VSGSSGARRRRVAWSGEPAPEGERRRESDPTTWRWCRSRGCRTRWPALATAPAGGSSARGAATPTTALARSTATVGGGSVAGGLPLGRRLGTGGGAVECRCRCVSLVRHGELLEEKLIPHHM
jgi:hypothetical protein